MTLSRFKNNAKIIVPIEAKAQVLMEIEYGRPSKKCKNFGICNMTAFDYRHLLFKSEDRKSKAIITIFHQNYIELDLIKCSMSPFTYNLFFANPTFLVQEDFTFHSDNDEAIPSFHIKKGAYPFKETDQFIKIIFKHEVL